MNADQKKKKKRAVPGMDLHDPRPGLLGGGGELDLSVQAAGAEEGGIQDVDPVRRRDHFDVVLRKKLGFYLNLSRTTRALYR
jgi:hypothetical protein